MLPSACGRAVREASTVPAAFKTHRKKGVWVGGGEHGNWKEPSQNVNSCYW